MPGTPGFWVLCGAAVAASTALLAIGAAILISGTRRGRAVAHGLAVIVLAWSGADLYWHRATSPLTLLGRLALWPLHVDALALVGVAVALVVPAVAVVVVGGTSLEAAERRASLAGQLRFAATLQDIRTVVVLRRQLAQERPRTQPWLRLPRPAPDSDGPKHPIWRRGWHGILRWPLGRVGRMVLLAVVAGLSLVATWRGTTPLVVLAGLALFVAGLDAVEPLAQDVDHPDRLESVPVVAGEVHVRHMPASALVMIATGVVAIGAAAAVTRDPGLVLPIGGLMLLPTSVAVVAGAAMSVIKGPATSPGSGNFFVPPEAAGLQVVFRVAWPPLLGVLTLLPLFAARAARLDHKPYLGPLAAAEIGAVVVAAMGILWVRWQQQVHESLEGSMTQGARRG